MEACGLDPNVWEVISYRHSEYDGMAKIDEELTTKRMYAIKLNVKPRKQHIDLDKFINKIDKIKPYTLEPTTDTDKHNLLEIGTVDMHFGNMEFEDYKKQLNELLTLIEGKETVIFLLGNDYLHADNLEQTTTHGTFVGCFNMDKAWEDGWKFASSIIEKCIKQGTNIIVKYIPANHDYSSSWQLCKALEKRYPQAVFDNSTKRIFKAYRYYNVAIGWTHGHRGKKNDYDRIFATQYQDVFKDATVKEIHSAHKHHEEVKDTYGVLVRTLPTANKKDEYTLNRGYHSVLRFQCFEYTPYRLKTIHYI